MNLEICPRCRWEHDWEPATACATANLYQVAFDPYHTPIIGNVSLVSAVARATAGYSGAPKFVADPEESWRHKLTYALDWLLKCWRFAL